MSNDYFKSFTRMSGGKLFRLIDNTRQQDPSERVNLDSSNTKEIFKKAGLSGVDHALWLDTEMLNGMEKIALRQWSLLNSNNLKIQSDFEDCIADNTDQFNWQDISLSWEEAVELAAEEYVRSERVVRSSHQEIQKEENKQNVKLLTWQEMKQEILRSSPGITSEAMRQAAYRAIKKAQREQLKPPIPLAACFKGKGYAIYELCNTEKNNKNLVENCKYSRK